MADNAEMVVVCGGGGVWGVAWMTGLAAGLSDAGVDLKAANKFIGTSAGSVVATQLTSSLETEELFQRQVDPARQAPERLPPAGSLEAMIVVLQKRWASQEEKLTAICDLALSARTISAAERRADIAARLSLPAMGWPSAELAITAVDVAAKDLCVFDAQCGVDLIDAVAASCAVPGVWPLAEIGERRYTDGGVWRTAENAHLAQGAKSVLILSPLGQSGLGREDRLASDIKALEAGGAEVVTIYADQASLGAMVPHALDPATRKPAAEAGRRQAAGEANRVRHLFG